MSSESQCSISTLPTEVLYKIFDNLNPSDAITSALVCQRWKELSNSLSAETEELRFVFNSGCKNSITWDDFQMLVNACACKSHTPEQCILIRELFAIKGLERIRCLHLEDEMPKPNDGIPDSYMKVIMRKLNKNVETMQFTNVDLSYVNVWTFAAFANFRHISHLVFVDCNFPSDMNQAKFIKAITPILPMVEQLEITGTAFVNDQFGFALAKSALSLGNVNLQNCPNISAITIASFCTCPESQARKRPIVFDLHSTKFDVDELHQLLYYRRREKFWDLNLSDLRPLTGRITVTVTDNKTNDYTIFY